MTTFPESEATQDPAPTFYFYPGMGEPTNSRRFFHDKHQRMKMNYAWGVWQFDEERLALQHKDGTYCLSLLGLTSTAELLDQIAQLNQAGKDTLYGKTALSDLVRALDELFYLQGHVCSFGQERSFNVEQLLRQYVKRYYEELPNSKPSKYRWAEVGTCTYKRFDSRKARDTFVKQMEAYTEATGRPARCMPGFET